MQIAIIILSVTTLSALVALVWVILRSHNSDGSAELTSLRTKVTELQSDLRHSVEENERIRQESAQRLLEVKAEAAESLKQAKEDYSASLKQVKEEADRRVQEEREQQKKHYDRLIGQQKENADNSLKTLREHFTEAFLNLKKLTTDATDEMLRQRQSEFSETSQKSIDTILSPLREQLSQMQKSMTDSRVSQTELKTAMEKEIENLLRQTTLTAQSADELARALTHDAKYQGNWGERECEELLKHEGLRRGIEYETQVNIKYTDNLGKLRDFRPDFILHLDTKRDVVIDAKVSLTAFKDYCNATTTEEQHECLKRHVQSMESHVRELAEKDYASYLQSGKTMSFVIMFVPITGALWTALQQQPDLWQRAMDRGVYIADEQTLYAALKIIQMTWTQIKQAQNHEEVYKLANEMIERVGQFAGYYTNVGKALEKAVKAYDDGQKKFEEKGQSIVQSANKLLKLGAKQSTKNPVPELLDVDDIPALDKTDLFDSKEDTNILED